MIVRFKDKDGHFRRCECADRNCSKRHCFSPGYAVHSSPGAYNGAWRDKQMSCVFRDYHGCPENEGGAE